MSNYRVIILFVFYSISISFFTKAQENQAHDFTKKIPQEQLLKDFQLLRDALEEGHAGLYIYSPKEIMDEIFENVKAEIQQPMTEIEFFRLLAPLIARIKDGHTSLSPSESYINYAETAPNRFPFKLKFIDNKAYILRNYSDNSNIHHGAEIISINGRSMNEILQLMFLNTSADGSILTSKYRDLESTNYFGLMYNLLFGESLKYKIKYRNSGSEKENEAEIAGANLEKLQATFAKRYPKEASQEDLPIELKILDNKNTAILKITSFNEELYLINEMEYPDFLEKAFKKLQSNKIKNLIIDLRNNPGGNDEYGKMLFAYLTNKKFTYYNSLEINRNDFKFLLQTDVANERIPSYMIEENERGTYQLKNHVNLGEQEPSSPGFDGKLFVLINGATLSTAGEFASVLHYHQKAVFIGEECGSAYYGNTAGFMPELTLASTQLRLRIPMVRYHLAVEGYPLFDRGLLPKYEIKYTIENILKSRDLEMEEVMKLLEKE